ncbi:MAG: hypothetical protein HY420_03750 [Candidatus Kerfeldbacteria bacterium]|nr:hypothetical protein [Candidatus Kerfeldbacteria bacterium]
METALVTPARYVSVVALTLLLLFIAYLVVLRRSTTTERMTLMAVPIVALAGVAFALYFFSGIWIRHATITLTALGMWVYTEELYRFTHEPGRYHQFSLEHLAGLLSMAALAGAMAGVFGLRIFLDVRLIYLLPLTFLATIIVSASVLAVQPLARKFLWSSTAVLAILITETAWAVYFLPTHYWVDSLIVTIPFYVSLNLMRHELSGTLDRQHIQRYAAVGIITMGIVLTTAQWVL